MIINNTKSKLYVIIDCNSLAMSCRPTMFSPDMQLEPLQRWTYEIRPNVRDVSNRLTESAIAHLVNYFAHPVNSTYPLPKIAQPVNYLAHGKNRHCNNYKQAF